MLQNYQGQKTAAKRSFKDSLFVCPVMLWLVAIAFARQNATAIKQRMKTLDAIVEEPELREWRAQQLVVLCVPR